MDVDRLTELLKQSISDDTNVKENAGKHLAQIHKIIGFSSRLIEIVLNDRADINVRQAAVNCLTDNVVKYWDSNNMLGDNVAQDLLYLVISNLPKTFRVSVLDLCATFSKTAPSTALSLWNKLCILVPTLDSRVTSSSNWSCGILSEIGDIEPRTQDYSITISFLKMLNNILEHVAYFCLLQSPHLQHSNSAETCINLVTNLIFLKVSSRQYNKMEDKWIILNLCLETFQLFISRYEPVEDGNSQRCSFALMSQILQEGDIFKCIAQNIEEAVNHLEELLINDKTSDDATSNQPPYKQDPLIDRYIFLAINLLNSVALKQHDFMAVIKKIPGYPTALNVNLDVLFNGINPKTGNVDRLAFLIRIPALGSNETTLETLKLLKSIIQHQPSIAQQVSLHLSFSTSPLVHDDNLVTMFVNCLSSDSHLVRRAALTFISTCLEHRVGMERSSYNLAHELLGFDRQMTTLREPGSMGKVFDCLHAIIGFFDQDTYAHPDLKEERTLGLEIIHKLCTDVRTCDVTLRFLRSSYDFLSKYLKKLFKLVEVDTLIPVLDERISELVWFFRIISVEIKLSWEKNLKSVANNHLSLLLGDMPRKLIELLPDHVCGQTHPIMPNWECFDNDELWKTVAQQADKDATINLKELHRKLAGEVKMVNLHLGSTQKNLISDEISEILDFAGSLNESYKKQAKKSEYFNAWREFTEVVITVNALDGFENDTAIRILFEIIHELMSKTKIANFTTGIMPQLSSTILLASSLLRFKCMKSSTMTDFMSLASSIHQLLEQSSSLIWGQFKGARVNLYAAYLHAVRALPETICRDLDFNHSLLEKIYKDALIGPEIIKVLSLTILTQTDLTWVESAARDGSLRHLIESLAEDDLEIVATRGEILTKEFYAFDSKLTLFNNIAITSSGARALVHLNLMDVLGSLRIIDSYLMMLDENTIFQKLFVGVVRLMKTLSTTLKIQHKNIFKIKPIIHTEILRNIPVLMNTEEGRETLLQTTCLQTQIISEAESTLQHDFVNSVQHFTRELSSDMLKILVNILTGCTKILLSHQKPTPIFAASWNASSSTVLSQPSLGYLVWLINSLKDHVQKDDIKEIIRENCIYLIWSHSNIYFDVNYKTKATRELETFRNELPIVLNDAFFNNLASSQSQFVDVFSRKVRKLRISVM